jgi:hypothetical protein
MEPNFDRPKTFYPYVINYISILHGLLELLSRKSNELVKQVKEKDPNKNWDEEIKNMADDDLLKKILASGNFESTVLLGDLSLKSQHRQKNIAIDINEIAGEFLNNHNYLLPFQLKAAGVLMIMAYETTKDT